MAIHLVGENIDKTRSHTRPGPKLVELMRGIYVDADDDIEAPSSGTLSVSPNICTPKLPAGRERGPARHQPRTDACS